MTGPRLSAISSCMGGESPRPKEFDAKPAAEGIRKGPEAKKATVLFVDDEEIVRRSAIRALRDERLMFREAKDGAEALDLFRKGGVDVVITDLRMPKMGGLELLQRIRASDGNAKVIVTSGDFSNGERTAVYVHGALAALDKPYNLPLLKATINAALIEEPRAPEAPSRSHARILVVDDDPDARETLGLLLDGEGYSVRTAENGLDGLACYYAGRTDIVISDLHMPLMSGHEMLREIRAANPAAVVIMVSGEANARERAALVSEGASEVMQKPIDFDALLERIRRALSD